MLLHRVQWHESRQLPASGHKQQARITRTLTQQREFAASCSCNRLDNMNIKGMCILHAGNIMTLTARTFLTEPWYLRSLIRVFAGRSLGSQGSKESSSGQRRHISPVVPGVFDCYRPSSECYIVFLHFDSTILVRKLINQKHKEENINITKML